MSARGDKPRTRQLPSWLGRESNVRTLLSALMLALFIRIVLFEAFEIEGPSMEPTLLNGDRVVVAKFMYGLFLPFTHHTLITWGTPDLGDVVIVKSPMDGVDIVKRVVGLPGDTMELREDIVYRNGTAVPRTRIGPCPDEPGAPPRFPGCQIFEERLGNYTYRISRSSLNDLFDMEPVHVPPGHVFILGDHRDRSNDSRYFAPPHAVPIARIKGAALALYWSAYNKFPDGDYTIRWHRFGRSIQ